MALLGAVNTVKVPVALLTLPAEALQAQVPGGAPAIPSLTSSPTPTVVLARLAGVVATHWLVISGSVAVHPAVAAIIKINPTPHILHTWQGGAATPP
jgi:hypothetical protein